MVLVQATWRILFRNSLMVIRRAFAKALRVARNAASMTQEDFGLVSSRTYISSLERGQKSPTLDKIDAIAAAMKIHPLTLLAMTYVGTETKELERLFRRIGAEIADMNLDD